VTDLATLKEAIRLRRTEAPSSKVAACAEQHRNLAFIADAILDPSPISVEALKGMGWIDETISDLPSLAYRKYGIELEANFFESGVDFWNYTQGPQGKYSEDVNPPPATIGQLLFLLLSLSEKESS
jgi:hypothetical protein